MVSARHAEVPRMNCGKNVKLKPMNVVTALNCDIFSGYIRPVILGHQKCTPDEISHQHAAHHHEMEMGHDKVSFGQMDVRSRCS